MLRSRRRRGASCVPWRASRLQPGSEVSSRCAPSSSPTAVGRSRPTGWPRAAPRSSISARCAATSSSGAGGEVAEVRPVRRPCRSIVRRASRSVLGWRAEDGVLHRARAGMSTIRVRSAGQLLAGRCRRRLWMLGVGGGADRAARLGVALGRPRVLAGKPAHLRQLCPLLRQQDLSSGWSAARCLHTAMLMAITGVLGYCIAYFLAMKVQRPRLAAGALPRLRHPVLDQHADPRRSPGCPSSASTACINQFLMFTGATSAPIEAFLYSRTGITMAQVSLYTHDGRRAGRVHAEQRSRRSCARRR